MRGGFCRADVGAFASKFSGPTFAVGALHHRIFRVQLLLVREGGLSTRRHFRIGALSGRFGVVFYRATLAKFAGKRARFRAGNTDYDGAHYRRAFRVRTGDYRIFANARQSTLNILQRQFIRQLRGFIAAVVRVCRVRAATFSTI